MNELPRDRLLPEGPHDLVVIGGGINGAAIARDAVLRGHETVLLERDDLAAGTSSASSKMVHGGIRYLEQLRLGLVYESLRERHLLVRLAPHLVRPQPFIIPVYEGARRGPRWVRLGLWLYDLLCLGRRLGPSGLLSRDETLARVPELLSEGLQAGGLYQDAVMDDARLVVLNAVGAAEEARRRSLPFFLRTYTEVEEVHRTSPVRLKVRDRLTGRTQSVYAHRVARALGPWTEPDRLVPSKGMHLVLRAFPIREGLLLQHTRDHRVFFVIPWLGRTVVGTTETPFSGDPATVQPEAEDVEYLLSELRRLFPGIRFEPRDILGMYAGVRPLARSGWRPPWVAEGPGTVSRNHLIIEEGRGVVSVFGGKYTTYRVIAKQVVDHLFGRGGCTTHRVPIPGGEEGPWESFRARLASDDVPAGLDEAALESLFRRHGCRLRRVLDLGREDPSLLEPLAPGTSVLRAEALLALREEYAVYPEDVVVRRTPLHYTGDGGRAAYAAVEEIVREHAAPLPPDLDADRIRYLERCEREDRLSGKIPAPT